MLLYLLQILVVSQCLYFIFRNKIDFLFVFYCSTLLYHWQIVYGVVWVPPYEFQASRESMAIVLIIFLTLFAFSILHDYLVKNKQIVEYDFRYDRDKHRVIYVLIGISLLSSMYSLSIGYDKLLLGKGEYISATLSAGLTYDFITYFPAAMAFLYGVVTRKRLIIFLSLVPLLIYLLIGYRAVFVTALVGAVTVSSFNARIRSLKVLRIAGVLLLLFTFFVVYKFSYIAIKAGDFDFIESVIEKDSRFDDLPQFLSYAMFSAEFGQVSSNLSLSSERDMNDEYSFSTAALGSVPVLNRILDINEDDKRFSRYIEKYANPGFSYGLGGSIWGEAYKGLGYGGVILFSIVIIGGVCYFNIQMYSNKEKISLLLYLPSFMAFYIHRNDFVLFVGNVKNIIILLVFSYLVLLILRGKVRVSRRTALMFKGG